tara:strand:- start:932 stop:1471 length:540 start_codon:yes stop_codon:yes gene_type:complete
MHNVLQQCQDEYNAGLKENWYKKSENNAMSALADKFCGYPIIYNNNGENCNGLIIFMVFDAEKREVLPMHKVVEQGMLDDVFNRLNLNQAKILSEIILGDHELNIKDDIAELEDYDHYYSCLVEDGVIVDNSFTKCKALEQALNEIEQEESLVGKFEKINQLGISKAQTLKVLIKSYVS